MHLIFQILLQNFNFIIDKYLSLIYIFENSDHTIRDDSKLIAQISLGERECVKKQISHRKLCVRKCTHADIEGAVCTQPVHSSPDHSRCLQYELTF